MTADAADRPALSPNLRGALWMLASALAFTAMTVLVKYLGDGYPPALQTFYRQAAGFAVLIPLILHQGKKAFATTRPGILFFRSAAGTIAMILSFYAYQELPLADANALSFTRTLWLVPLAAFVVREKVGPLRIVAAVIGFGGVLLMARPGADGFSVGLPGLAMLAASFLFALTITGMKVMTRDHPPTVLLVWAMTLGVVFAIPGGIIAWRWPEPVDFVLLCLMGVLGTITQGCYIKGMQAGDAAAMAPIDYTRLVFATIAGFVLFHDVPTVWTLAGAGIVVASTLFITFREQQLARSAKLSAAADGES